MMDTQGDGGRYQNYGNPDTNMREYDHYRRYSPDKDRAGDKERTRDRERRRERRRRERERDRDRRDDSRDRGRYRSREGRYDDDRGARPRGGSQENDEEYDYGEGFYEEGGYIDHPTHSGNHGDYNHRNQRDNGREIKDRDRGGDRWMTDTPTNTVLLRGLPTSVDEKDIKAELMLFGAPVKDVRLMKRKDTGASRGFAFVEFQNLTDAQRWMDQNQGHVLLLNQYRVRMHYSSPRNNRSSEPAANDRQRDDWQRTDWTCTKCGYHNFRRRDHCFKCSTTREESDRAKEGDGFDQVGNNPCNTLIFRGLDALTIEENIVEALTKLSTIAVKSIKVLRDDLTATSRGFGFAEFNTLAESSQMLEVIQNMPTPFEVDGKAIIVSYAKNTFSTTMATMSSWSQPPATPSYENSQGGYQYDSASGQYYNPTTGQYYDYAAYYAQQEASNGVTQTQTDSTNAAAAVAQAAIQQAQAAKHHVKPEMTKSADTKTANSEKSQTTATTATVDSPSTEYPKYPVPDVSTYQYDETSGYYFDPTTGLYYDASTQYYFNSTTNQFMYWDGEKQTYLPAPNQEQASHATGGNMEKKEENKNKKETKKKKVPTATLR